MKQVFLLVAVSLLPMGCAIHYFDTKSGTEHLWGFGHLKMKAVPQRSDSLKSTNAVMAFVTHVSTFGLSIGGGQEYGGISVGWDSRSRLVVKEDDASFWLLWPTNSIRLPWDFQSLFLTRVGTNFPYQLIK